MAAPNDISSGSLETLFGRIAKESTNRQLFTGNLVDRRYEPFFRNVETYKIPAPGAGATVGTSFANYEKMGEGTAPSVTYTDFKLSQEGKIELALSLEEEQLSPINLARPYIERTTRNLAEAIDKHIIDVMGDATNHASNAREITVAPNGASAALSIDGATLGKNMFNGLIQLRNNMMVDGIDVERLRPWCSMHPIVMSSLTAYAVSNAIRLDRIADRIGTVGYTVSILGIDLYVSTTATATASERVHDDGNRTSGLRSSCLAGLAGSNSGTVFARKTVVQGIAQAMRGSTYANADMYIHLERYQALTVDKTRHYKLQIQ